MKAQFLTGLIATTAAIASTFIGGAAKAYTLAPQSNLQDLDRDFYNTLVDDYLLRGLESSEGVEIVDRADYALNGDIVVTGNTVDVFLIDADPVYKAFALFDNTIDFTVNDGVKEDAFGLDGTDRVDDAVDEVVDGEGFTIKGLKTGDVLDFTLTSSPFPTVTNIFGAINSENPDGLQHIVAYEIQHDGYDWLYLGWEDILGTSTNPVVDWDFNDAAIVIRHRTEAVPEPGVTLALLGIAAGSLGLRRRKDAE
ncbi:MAG: PEP-CTERM sorting domain-containing protein [Cyanobacteria bacterium P01_E01_bin.42]